MFPIYPKRRSLKRSSIALNLILLFFAHWGRTQPTWEAKDIKALQVKASSLKLQLKKSKSSFYKIKASQGFELEKQEKGLLKIQSKDFSSRKLWSFKDTKALELTIEGPSVPLVLFASSSEIAVSGWESSLFVSSFQSKIKLENTRANTQLNVYQGQTSLKNHKADLKFKAFQNELSLENSEGVFDIQINRGRLRLKNSAGVLSFIAHHLNLRINNFKGPVKGFTHSGELRASLKPEILDLKTETAPVRVYVKGQGVRVQAYTKEGQIYAPKHLYKKYEGKSIRVSGKIHHSQKLGSMNIETGRGNIAIN